MSLYIRMRVCLSYKCLHFIDFFFNSFINWKVFGCFMKIHVAGQFITSLFRCILMIISCLVKMYFFFLHFKCLFFFQKRNDKTLI